SFCPALRLMGEETGVDRRRHSHGLSEGICLFQAGDVHGPGFLWTARARDLRSARRVMERHAAVHLLYEETLRAVSGQTSLRRKVQLRRRARVRTKLVVSRSAKRTGYDRRSAVECEETD